MLGLGRKELVGVDIGSYAVKVVQLRQSSRGWVVYAAGVADISDKGTDSAARKETNCVRAIHNCLHLAGVKTKLAVCGVGGTEVAIRNFEFPAVPAEEVDRAILLEAKQVCPFKTDKIAVDYRVIPDGKGKTQGYLVVATNVLVQSTTRLLKKARLDCTLMDVDGLALLNCFTEVEKPGPDHGTAILNIGSDHSIFAVEGQGGWPFIRYLNYAGESIIKKVAAENEMTLDDAKTAITGDPEKLTDEVRRSFEAACGRLIGDITNTLRYYEAQEKTGDIRKILVCGGFALVDELLKLLKDQLPIEVELWNPFEKMRCHVGGDHRAALVKNIVRKKGPSLAVAAGLAMRSI